MFKKLFGKKEDWKFDAVAIEKQALRKYQVSMGVYELYKVDETLEVFGYGDVTSALWNDACEFNKQMRKQLMDKLSITGRLVFPAIHLYPFEFKYPSVFMGQKVSDFVAEYLRQRNEYEQKLKSDFAEMFNR